MSDSDSPQVLQNGSSPQTTAGVKRKASFSSPETAPKRVVTESRKGLPSSASQTVHHCPVCHRPCWFCQASSVSEIEDDACSQEEDPEEAMAPREASTITATEISRESENSKTSHCSTARSGKRKRTDAEGRTYLGPKQSGFEENILNPCKVRTRFSPEDISPDVIFGEQPEIPSSRALLLFDDTELKAIAEDLVEYERSADDENALGVICAKRLLVQEYLQNAEGPVKTTSLRKDRWRPHKPGPSIENTVYFFDWDIEPDVTYAVSINQFDLHIRTRLKAAPQDRWLAEKRGSCPYLTIEYKCGAKTGKRLHAVYQNVTASVIWLYQRRTMRQELNTDITDLRHYSIVLMDGNYEVWEACCTQEGFVVQILAMGNLKLVRELKHYIRWSNAIHTWGLTTNADSYKKDVLELLKRIDERPPFTSTSLERNAQLADAPAASSTQEETIAAPPNTTLPVASSS